MDELKNLVFELKKAKYMKKLELLEYLEEDILDYLYARDLEKYNDAVLNPSNERELKLGEAICRYEEAYKELSCVTILKDYREIPPEKNFALDTLIEMYNISKNGDLDDLLKYFNGLTPEQRARLSYDFYIFTLNENGAEDYLKRKLIGEDLNKAGDRINTFMNFIFKDYAEILKKDFDINDDKALDYAYRYSVEFKRLIWVNKKTHISDVAMVASNVEEAIFKDR